MGRLSRRIFLQAGSAAALTPAAAAPAATHAGHAPAAGAGATGPHASAAADAYLFFNPAEAAAVEAAVLRLIPPDDVGPSALDAGVPHYIDLQLAGAWGAGERLYRSGPWAQGTPQQGYQLPYTPAELYRTALRGMADDLQRTRHARFEQLPGPEQDAYLTRLQTTPVDLGGVPSPVFFESLLAMTIEGYFCDPVYGGNRGMAAWAMIGFPGAYANYYHLIDQYGVAFTQAPRSLAEVRGQVHVHADIPAFLPAGSKR
jgi:gluconate 2-dehydrogenase gamma chain